MARCTHAALTLPGMLSRAGQLGPAKRGAWATLAKLRQGLHLTPWATLYRPSGASRHCIYEKRY